MDGAGRLRGRMWEGNNETLQIYGAKGQYLGYYQQSADKTFDAAGRYVGPGDQRMTLLED